MSELKAIDDLYERRVRNGSDPYKIKIVDVRHPPVYLKSAVDKVIADLEESHKKEVSQLLILNREQANSANRLRFCPVCGRKLTNQTTAQQGKG